MKKISIKDLILVKKGLIIVIKLLLVSKIITKILFELCLLILIVIIKRILI